MKYKMMIVFVVALMVVGCGKKAPAPGEPGNQILAEVNGEKITEEDVREAMGNRIRKIELDLYDAQEMGVDKIIEDKLVDAEAAKRGVSPESLLKTEVLDKVNVSDEEIKGYYESNKSRFGDKKFEELEGRIKGFLFHNRQGELRSEFVGGLKKSAKVEMYIKAPVIGIDVGSSPTIGPKGAPVTLVEFSDYQCPFCGRARPTINQLIGDYKDKLRYVFKDFPLSFHKDAFKAHEAAHCAGDQEKYWDYNKKVWENQGKLDVASLKKYATQVGLDANKFKTCLDSGKHSETVRSGLQQGGDAGVSGTPAFFVNGRMLSGARPYEAFKSMIDRELSK